MNRKSSHLKMIVGVVLLLIAAVAAYDLYGPQERHDGTILTQVIDTQTGSTRGGSQRFEFQAVLIKVGNEPEGLMVRSAPLWEIMDSSSGPIPVQLNQTPLLGTISKVMVRGVEFDVRFGGLHWQLIFSFSLLAGVLIFLDRRGD